MKNSLRQSKTSQMLRLRNLLPNVKGIGSLWVSDLLVKIIVELTLLAKTKETAEDHKSIVGTIDLQLGSGVMPANLLKLAARIAQLSERVEDGNDPEKLFQYVKAKLVYAAYKHGSTGRELLDWADEYVKQDLIDCKAGTLIHRRLAA